jgi:hypothetical protein
MVLWRISLRKYPNKAIHNSADIPSDTLTDIDRTLSIDTRRANMTSALMRTQL